MGRSDSTYLHGHHDSVLRSHRWRTAENSAAYLLGHLRPGMRLLDVGCGPGTITLGLASRVGDEGVVGVDRSPEVIGEARAEAARLGRPGVRFLLGDLYALDLPGASFDVVHAHQVLQHVPDPIRALGELRRLCRPGGIVAVRDADFGGMFWQPADLAMDEWRALYCRVARAVGGEPDCGRHLATWARAAGFEQIELSASAWCFASPDARAWWGGLWSERLTESGFAASAQRNGLAGRDELERLAATWRSWLAGPDACFIVPHVELLGRG